MTPLFREGDRKEFGDFIDFIDFYDFADFNNFTYFCSFDCIYSIFFTIL